MPAFACTHSCAYTHVRAPSLRLRRTVEGEYPHPSDSDYKFGDITKARMHCTLPCTCVRCLVPAGTPLTVPAPIFAQRMIRDMTGNKEYEFGDGSKALAEGSKEAAEKARGAPSAWYRSERARRSA